MTPAGRRRAARMVLLGSIAAVACACTAILGAQEPLELFDSGSVTAAREGGRPEAAQPETGSPSIEAGVLDASCPDAETACQGACADLGTDEANCGGCGVACGGTCTAGRCLVTLATGPFVAVGLAVDETSVYLADAFTGRILRLPIDGGPVTVLAATPEAFALTIDPTHVYWIDFSGVLTVLSIPKTGGGLPVTLASSYAGLGQMTVAIAVAGTRVFWIGESLQSVDVDGGDATEVTVPGIVNPPIAASATAVYVSASLSCTGGPCYRIVTAPSDGGGSSPLFPLEPGPGPLLLATSPTSLYWMAATCPGGNGCGTSLMAGSLAGGTVATVVAGIIPSVLNDTLAADEKSVYFAGLVCPEDGAPCESPIMSIGVDGGAITTLASDLGSVTGLAVDSTSLYWVTGTAVMKLTPK
jgi:hypothetical protein